MSEVEWDEEAETPVRKKRNAMPWVIGCGAGCLVVAITLAVIGYIGYRAADSMMDEEANWPKLQEVLPYDERPANLQLLMGFNIGIRQFTLLDPSNNLTAAITVMPPSGEKDFEELFESEPEGTFMGLGAPMNPVEGTIELQGREVRALWFDGVKPGPRMPGVRVDLSGDRGRATFAELRRAGSEERLKPEEVQSFFEPFDLWRER